jgi:hypothetical protein
MESQGRSLTTFLSSKGFSEIAKQNYEKDFTFYVGHCKYECPTFIAEFLSPRVSRHRESDSTMKTFYIEVEAEDASGAFSDILSIGFGSCLIVNETNVRIVETICSELGNEELYEFIWKNFHESLTLTNIVDRFFHLYNLEHLQSNEIVFAASHFFELYDKSDFQRLNIDIILEILSHPELKVIDEDSFCHFILDRIPSDADNFKLFEFVRFEYVSVSTMSELVNVISSGFDMLTFSVWQSIARRLILPVVIDIINDRTYLEFVDDKGPLDGIIAYLTQYCGGNVDDKNFVKITASSTDRGNCKTLADFGIISEFHTNNTPNSWVSYDFQRMKVIVTSYSIRSRPESASHFPLSWILEGSRDGTNWVELDRRENDSTFKQASQIAHFECRRTDSQAMRMIRLRLTGKNSHGYDFLCISGFEVFGRVSMIDK